MGVIITPDMDRLVKKMKRHASSGIWRGNTATVYYEHAKDYHPQTGTLLLYTRDAGMHSSGWFKNPDYDKCFHLSISFWEPITEKPRAFDNSLAETWVRCFFGDLVRYIWHESGNKPHGSEVHHYRVMVNQFWEPIIPRGEVYTKEFIEKGWLSFSDLKQKKQETEHLTTEELLKLKDNFTPEQWDQLYQNQRIEESDS